MLNFFRNYQKIIFGVVTAALIVSISFFGSYSAFLNRPVKEKDFVLGRAIDGSSMTYQDIEKMNRFIATDALDFQAREHGSIVNIFNDGVIRKDFFETKIATLLLQKYFDDIKEDLQQRLDKQKRYKPYVHPEAPFLTIENLWAQFFPSLQEQVLKIKDESFQLSRDNLSSLVSLYLDSLKLPPQLLKQFISYQENQYQWIKKDPYLPHRDLSLFYFHTFEDWFGKTFLNLISQVIHNAAIYAKQKGYKVSKEEAKADLLSRGFENLKKEGEQDVSKETLMQSWQQLLTSLQLTENEALGIWTKVMLYRKVFDDYGHSVFLDRLSFENFQNYASESVKIKVYSLPEKLKLDSFYKLMLFETYQDLISKTKPAHHTDMKVAKCALGEIEKKSPELVYKNYQVALAHLTQDQLMAYIGLKEMWDWQVQEENWKKLRVKFPEIAEKGDQDQLKRLDILEKLEQEKREQIDFFSKELILESSQDLIEKVLLDTEATEKHWKIAQKPQSSFLDGISNISALKSLLDQAGYNNQEEISQEAMEAKNKLQCYTQDKKNFYKISLLKREDDINLYTFDEAVEANILEPFLEKKLKQFYKKAKEEKPSDFQNEDGSFKEFSSVKEQIGKIAFKPILKQIEDDYEKVYGKKNEAHPLDFYAKHRFLYSFAHHLQQVKENHFGDAFYDDYQVLEEIKTISRNQKEDYVDENIFSMQPLEFSEIKSTHDGKLVFYQTQEILNQEEEGLVKKIEEGQTLLVEDAKRHMMSEFLQNLEETDSIHLEKVKITEEK